MSNTSPDTVSKRSSSSASRVAAISGADLTRTLRDRGASIIYVTHRIDDNLVKAAQIDGAKPVTIYWRVVLPLLRPVFFGACVVVGHMAVKSFELVLALTNGGPGYSTDLPATFFYAVAYSRDQLAIGSASAMVLLFIVASIAVPFMYSELGKRS